jgi:hypothetical protein
MKDRITAHARMRAGLLALAVLLAACSGGGGSYGGDGGNDGGGAGAPPPLLVATFESIQANVFTPLCVECHAGASAPLGLRLDGTNSYGLLVGISSVEQLGVPRVAPGNPNGSYLVQKLEGTAAFGARMPLGREPLPQSDIDVIRQWIVDGAQRQMSPGPSNPVRVTALSPLPNSVVDVLPSSIIALFDHELDASTVNATTFLVERSGGDGMFADGNEVSVVPSAVTVPLMNPASVRFELTGVPSIADTYRVRIVGTGPQSVQGVNGRALDGELLPSGFPSGDGTQGGDFVATFVVAGTAPAQSNPP